MDIVHIREAVRFYVECYWIPFVLGGIVSFICTRIYNKKELRRHQAVEARIKQLRRDARCGTTEW